MPRTDFDIHKCNINAKETAVTLIVGTAEGELVGLVMTRLMGQRLAKELEVALRGASPAKA
jgi:hypothetical protein